MPSSMWALATSTAFTYYLGSSNPEPRIETITDRGPILELIVKCGGTGVAIVTYSKIERLYCDPKLACDRDRSKIIRRSCG